MDTQELAREAVRLFEAVGGVNWQDCLLIGGVTVIAFLIAVAVGMAIYVGWEGRL